MVTKLKTPDMDLKELSDKWVYKCPKRGTPLDVNNTTYQVKADEYNTVSGLDYMVVENTQTSEFSMVFECTQGKRLEQEMAYLKYLIENRDFTDNEKERSQLTAFYHLFFHLQVSKSKVSGVINEENFQVNQIEVVKIDRFYTELNVSCQFMDVTEFESYY
ncbi:hypothetical protein HCJ45_06025 [Listeria sp. FSL L7-1517]|nr:hypothetical protein [Listeria immobilis]MBC6296666.1 hypothetical protein [Listeria immobilis]